MAAVYVIGTLVVLFILGRIFSPRKKDRGVQIENIRAQLILISTDPKEIEDFLLVKEPYITQELITQLIARVTELKTGNADLTQSKNGEL